MKNSDERLLDLLDDSIAEKFPGWRVEREYFEADGHRVMAPPEPCDQCGQTVFLVLYRGFPNPLWLMWGELKEADTLFPECHVRRHKCGDGESWSVEAALFVESAMREWALVGGESGDQ